MSRSQFTRSLEKVSRSLLSTGFQPSYTFKIDTNVPFKIDTNAGPKRKASECMLLTTGKMSFYALLT